MATPNRLPSPIPVPRPGLDVLLRLAWPIVVSRSCQVVVGVCDALMVAPLGEAALAATTTGALDAFTLLILPMGVVFIVSTFASQLWGEGDLDGARRHGLYGLLVALATQVLALAAIAATPAAAEWMPYRADVRDSLVVYLEIRLLSAGPAIGLEALGNYYGGLGNTRLPMRASVAAMVLNVAGNWILIGGNLGAPALGVAGAAWASSISTALAFAWLFSRYLRDGAATGRRLPRVHAAELRRMLRYGLPSGFNWFFEFLAFAFFVNVVVAGLGTTSLAAMMAVLQINSVAFMPAFGLASAGAILVGQAIGSGAKADVPAIVRLTFLTAAVWQGVVGLAYLALPELVFAPFVGGDGHASGLREAGVRLLRMSVAWQLFDAAATTLAEALRAAGDTAYVLWARVFLAWAVFAPGAWLTVNLLDGGDVGAVAWLVVYLALLALALFLRFRGGAWRRFRLTERLV